MSKKMKDSGIEWIGEIPENWETTKVKNIINKAPKSNILAGEGSEEGLFPFFTSSNIQTKRINKALYSEESIILGTGGSASVHYSKESFSTSTDCLILQNKLDEKILLKYLYYKILSEKEIINDLGFSGMGLKHLQTSFLMNMTVFMPSIKEQEKIVNYLDEKVSKIDDVISKTKEAIDEYKEYKKSIITEVVTKGLDKDVKMKNSGVEWIGEIPEHWGIVKIKNYFNVVLGGTPKSNIKEYWDGSITWVTPSDYKTEDVYISKSKRSITFNGLNNCSASIIPKNSIIISTRAPIGLIGITKKEISTNQGCKALINKNSVYISNKYVYYYLSIMKHILNTLGRGTTFLELSSFDLKNFKILLPDIDNQKEIAEYLDEKTSEIDKLITEKETLISELEKYKKSLIYECVTGKKEIV